MGVMVSRIQEIYLCTVGKAMYVCCPVDMTVVGTGRDWAPDRDRDDPSDRTKSRAITFGALAPQPE